MLMDMPSNGSGWSGDASLMAGPEVAQVEHDAVGMPLGRASKGAEWEGFKDMLSKGDAAEEEHRGMLMSSDGSW
jgi:hypothetical protein